MKGAILCQVQQVEGEQVEGQCDQPFGRAAQRVKIERWTKGRVKGAPGLLFKMPQWEAIQLRKEPLIKIKKRAS
jgi:hypothetical protein